MYFCKYDRVLCRFLITEVHNEHKEGRVIYSIYFLGSVIGWGLLELYPVHLFACRGSTARSSPVVQDRAESSELQSFSDSLRSRLNAVSMRYGFLNYNECELYCLVSLSDINLSCD